MGWNPFRKGSESSEPAKTPAKKQSLVPPALPDYDDREDTQRIVTLLEDYRRTRAATAADLVQHAEDTENAAKSVTRTIRSMPAFVIPALADGSRSK